MVKLNFGSNENWLSAKKVIDGKTLKFLSQGEWKESDKFTYDNGDPKRDFVIDVEYEGEEFKMRVNATSRKNIAGVNDDGEIIEGKGYGDVTSTWIGKNAIIKIKDSFIGGKDTKCLILEPEIWED